MTLQIAVPNLRACKRDLELAEVAASPDHLTHYVIVRRDLPIGVLGVSILHAAGESSPGSLPNDTHGVLLVVPDEGALRTVQARLRLVGAEYVPIVETDGPHAGQMMAIGVVPGRKEVVGRHLSSLPLLRS